MAPFRTSPQHRANREFLVLKALAGICLAIVAFAGPTGAAHAPDLGSATAYTARLEQPSLSKHGGDLFITGSIDHIFRAGGLIGPNRALKQDRARPAVELAELTRDFEGIRARIAALRNPRGLVDPAAAASTETAAADTAAPVGSGPLPVAIAAVDPALTTPALDAIESATTPGGVPLPKSMSTKLAYARADLPATVFDGTVTDRKGRKVSDKEVWCMATAIYFESRGEAYRGQVAVGQVVMNRVAHKLYPDTICSVVFQNQSKRNACQFSFACDGIPERITDQKSWKQAMAIATDVIAGKEYLTDVGHSTHYHATYVYPHWAPRMKKNVKIGQHVFYQFKRGWKFG